MARLVSIAELAFLTETCESTWRKKIAKGEVPVVRIGRSIRIAEHVVQEIPGAWAGQVRDADESLYPMTANRPTPTADPIAPPLTSTDPKTWATYYHSLGLHPLPMRPDKKAPYLDEWKPFQERQPTLKEMDGWDWRFGVGVTTNGFILVDCDGGGEQQLADKPFPPSWTVRSGRGGLHRYFRAPAGRPCQNVTDLFKQEGCGQVDIKADGGFAVLPPTIHPETRRRYQWLLPPWSTIRLAEVPEWLLEEVQRRATSARNGDSPGTRQTEPWISELLRGVPEGQRNDGAARLAGYLAGKGIPEDVALAFLDGYAARCLPPFPSHELGETVRSIYTTHARNEGTPARAEADSASGAIVIPLSAVAPEPVSWLWRGRIPKGKVANLREFHAELVLAGKQIEGATALLQDKVRVLGERKEQVERLLRRS